MRFQFKPSENTISFREYLTYLTQTLEATTLYKKTMFPTGAIAIFSIFASLLIYNHEFFTYILIRIIGVSIFYILVILIIIKIKSKKSIKNNKIYCDIESTFYFTIEDGNLIRENEFSNIKLKLSEIKNVKILKHGLILYAENERVSLFIPKHILPVTLEEFISLIREGNNDLIVIEEFKRSKKLSRKRYMLLGITFILACIFSFFLGKYNYEHNFTSYNLIMESNLIKQDNNTYIYENESLGVSLTFPSKWTGKFGIEEMEDRINVYYLVNGKQSNNTALLFSVSGLSAFYDDSDFNIIKDEGLYIFRGPAAIELKEDSEEYLEYLGLYRDILNIQLDKNKY